MYIIGFENLYGLGDRDCNDMVFSLRQFTSTLNITVTLGGTTDPTPGAYVYPTLANVTVTAIPNTHYTFDHWELDGVPAGSGNPYTAFLSNPYHELLAVFELRNYTLTIVASSGGTTNPTAGIYTHAAGTNVSVSASPDINYFFDHWILDGLDAGSANPIYVSMYDDHVLEPVFVYVPPTYYLTVGTDPEGVTTISGSGWHDEDANAFLSAPPAEGYVFLNWTIDDISQGSGVTSISVNMNEPHKAVAHYRLKIVVGGITVFIRSPLLNAWIGFNSLLIAITIVTASWVKRRRSKNR